MPSQEPLRVKSKDCSKTEGEVSECKCITLLYSVSNGEVSTNVDLYFHDIMKQLQNSEKLYRASKSQELRKQFDLQSVKTY